MAYVQVGRHVAWHGGHVPDEVEAAAEAYRAALTAVDQAKASVKAALSLVPVARSRLAREIVAEYERGARVTDLAARSGYGREQIRRILRRAGVDPE